MLHLIVRGSLSVERRQTRIIARRFSPPVRPSVRPRAHVREILTSGKERKVAAASRVNGNTGQAVDRL